MYERAPDRLYTIFCATLLLCKVNLTYQVKQAVYNVKVPTPFYHLNVAADLLNHAELSDPPFSTLKTYRAEFFLGNTAPDVQTVSGQDRRATHFFDLPIRKGMIPAWEKMLALYPSLIRPANLHPAQAAFLAGYLCHLQADWLWVVEVFAPVFGLASTWNSFEQRLYLHNVLRAYLDTKILSSLPSSMGTNLRLVSPASWLPFVKDVYLCQWRDFLAQQLQPGAFVRTVEVFAARQGIPAEAYYRLINSEERLDQEIFVHLPRKALVDYRQSLLEKNVRLLQTYFLGA